MGYPLESEILTIDTSSSSSWIYCLARPWCKWKLTNIQVSFKKWIALTSSPDQCHRSTRAGTTVWGRRLTCDYAKNETLIIATTEIGTDVNLSRKIWYKCLWNFQIITGPSIIVKLVLVDKKKKIWVTVNESQMEIPAERRQDFVRRV